MATTDTQELDGALTLLRHRLDRSLARTFDEGDFAANLFHHLRTRTSPRMPFSPGRLPDIARLCTVYSPDQWEWDNRIAEEAVAGRMYAASNPYCDRFVEVDRETFDFSAYDHPDPQAIHGLNRTRWFADLARTYWLDQDPARFDALMAHWDFYAARVSHPNTELFPRMHATGRHMLKPPYHELDTFIRLTNWWWSFWLSLHAAPMTAERCCILLARCLRLFDLVAARGIKMHKSNFTAMQMEALYLWAGSLPEMTGMDVWRTNARNSAEASLAQSVLGDGLHWEKSVAYHAGCVRWYGVPFLFARQWGEPWAEDCDARLRRMGAFLDAVVMPDGKLPLLSDSDRNGAWRDVLALLHCMFPDMRFRHPVGPTGLTLWITDGEEWEPAKVTGDLPATDVFPVGGVAIARDEATGSMLILDNGPSDASHSHYDNMTLHYTALGGAILTDPGRAIYRQDTDRAWVLHPCSHNTAWIEDRPAEPAAEDGLPPGFELVGPGDPRMTPVSVTTEAGIHRMDTGFQGFCADRSARVQRSLFTPADGSPPWLVVIDRIASDAEHVWTNSWLFPGEPPVEAVDGGYRATMREDLRVNFAVTDGLDMKDDAMFWCPDYAVKEPARWVRFSSRLSEGLRAFVFCPHGEPRAMPAVRLESDRVIAVIDDREHTFTACP